MGTTATTMESLGIPTRGSTTIWICKGHRTVPCFSRRWSLEGRLQMTPHEQRKAKLESYGFTCGPRDPRLNRAFKGKFMVVENHDESELPTDSGADGPWCIVGDDLPAL